MSGNGIRLYAKFVLDRGMAVTPSDLVKAQSISCGERCKTVP